ncbi:MAG: hypothetical protein R3275_13145 [Saprospiraceae bacterium]|nr:hypothetical protein [Saprospiraceae bacterium]
MVKQIVGSIFLIVFIGFLGNKFYHAVEDLPYASLIIFLAVVITIIVIIAVAKQLRGY